MSCLFHSVNQIKETYLQDIYAIIRKKKKVKQETSRNVLSLGCSWSTFVPDRKHTLTNLKYTHVNKMQKCRHWRGLRV